MELEQTNQLSAPEYSLIEHFCEIDRRLAIKIHTFEAPAQDGDKVDEIIKAFSNQFLDALDSKLKSVIEGTFIQETENGPRDQQLNQFINAYFIWKLAHIVYLQKRECKALEYLAVIRYNFPPTGRKQFSFLRHLCLGEMNELAIELADFKFENYEVSQFLHKLEQKLAVREHFYKPFNLDVSEYHQKVQFRKLFEAQKQEFRDLLQAHGAMPEAALAAADAAQRDAWQSLGACLRLLAGDVDFILEAFAQEVILLIALYLLFVDPTLDEETFAEFSLRFAQAGKSPAKAADQSLRISSTSAEMSPQIVELLFTILGNPFDAHRFVQASLSVFPAWMNYHLGKLLLVARKIKTRTSIAELNNLDYHEFLLREYLDYLIFAQASFKLFRHYYLQDFDFDRKINVDLLGKILLINIKEQYTLETLREKGCQFMVERAIRQTIQAEETCKLCELKDLLLFLNYSQSDSLADRLLALIFNYKRHPNWQDVYAKELEYCRLIQQDSRDGSPNLACYARVCEMKDVARQSTDFKVLFENAAYVLPTLEGRSLLFFWEVFKHLNTVFLNFDQDASYKFDEDLLESVNLAFQEANVRARLYNTPPETSAIMKDLPVKLLKLF